MESLQNLKKPTRMQIRSLSSDLYNAVLNGDVALADELLRKGADPWAYIIVNKGKIEKPLFMAIKKDNFEMTKLLLECRSDFDSPRTLYAFHEAVRKGNPRILNLFLQYNVDGYLTLSCKDEETALHIACREGHEEIVQLLVEAGSDIERRDSKGFTPLNIACSDGFWNIVKYFISIGASVNTVNNDGENPLFSALRRHHSDWEVIELLLKKGANVNHYKNNGGSALSTAICGCTRNLFSPDIIDILLQYGFNLKIFTLSSFEFWMTQDAIFEKLIHIGWTFSIRGRIRLEETPLFIFLTEKKLNLAYLFLAASRDLQREKWIQNEEKLMKIEDEEMRQLLVSRASETIPSLKRLCRFAIRDLYGYQATTKVADLPLPKPLKDYLQLKSA